MTREEAVALLERYSNYDGMGIPNLAGCKEAMRVAVDALKEACPELAESEDERIRKAIVKSIEEDSSVYEQEVSKEQMLAWLEKQKEKKQSLSEKFRPDFPAVADFIESVDNMERNRAIGILEDYLKWAVNSEEECRYTWKELADAIQLGIDAMKEQKPAEWSEEDEKLLDFWLDVIDRNDWRMDENFCKASREFINRIKSLRPQYHGDVTMTEAYKMGKEAGEASHWKPSEEQVAALNSLLCQGDFSYIGQAQTLQSLYIDLMKL